MLLLKDDAGWVARYREVDIVVWHKPGDLTTLMQRHELQRKLVAETKPKKIITFTVVHDGAIKPLEGEVRAALNKNIKEHAEHVKAAVTIIPATGLKAAIVRGIIASLTLVTGAGYPLKVAATEDDAYKWLNDHLEPPGSATEMSALYDSLRAPAK